MLECAGTVPAGLERLHEPERDARVVRVVRGSHPPPFRRTREVALLFCGVGKGLHRLCVGGAEPLPLAIEPALEFGGVIEEKTIEQGTLVQRRAADGVAARERCLESRHVRLDHLAVQPQLIAR